MKIFLASDLHREFDKPIILGGDGSREKPAPVRVVRGDAQEDAPEDVPAVERLPAAVAEIVEAIGRLTPREKDVLLALLLTQRRAA